MNLPHILDNIVNIFKPKGESVLGIDIGGSSIKIVQVRNHGGQAVLETYGEVALGPYMKMDIGQSVKLSPDLLVGALNDVLKESNATTKICGLAVPITSSLITTMKTPFVSGDNLEEIVTMEARRYIPMSMQEITLDWQVIPNEQDVSKSESEESELPAVSSVSGPSEEENNSKLKNEKKSVSVLIVAVHTEIIERLKDVAVKAGLDHRFVELEAFSVIRSIWNRQEKNLVVVDFGASSTKVYITEKGIIRSSHTISFGSQDVTLAISRSTGVPIAEAERLKYTKDLSAEPEGSGLKKLLEGIVSYSINEVRKIIRDYESQNKIVLGNIVITGGGANVKGFAEAFSEKMATPVRVADPFSNLVAPAFLQKLLKTIGPSYSVAIGAALRALEEGH